MNFQGQQIAHDLCRGVQKSSGRVQLQEIFTARSSRDGGMGENRGHVPYHWRIERAQFLTPLILEQEKAQIAQMPYSADVMLTLDESTRHFIRETHEQVVAFDAACVAPLLKHIPNSSQALNPYTEKLPLRLIDDSFDPVLKPLHEKTLSQISGDFQNHPAIEVLTSRLPLMEALSPNELHGAVRTVEQQWRYPGPMNTATEYGEFLFHAPVFSAKRQEMGFITALVSLRASLRILNQLIFQAIMDDKPPILDDESVFAIKSTSHATGHGVDAQYQPNELTGLAPQTGDIFFLKAFPNFGLNKNRLCEVGATSFSLGQHGMVEQLLLRVLDDNLCPFDSYWQRAFNLI